MFLSGKVEIIITLILLAILSDSRIIVVRVINVVDKQQISIATKFKYNQVILTNKTRQLAAKPMQFEDINHVPTIKIEHQGIIQQKWMHLKGDTSVYMFKFALDASQLSSFLASLNHSRKDQVILIHKKHENEVLKSIKTDIKYCLFEQVQIKQQNIKNYLQKCLIHRIEEVQIDKQTELQLEDANHISIICITVLLFSMLTISKLLYFSLITKKDSVV